MRSLRLPRGATRATTGKRAAAIPSLDIAVALAPPTARPTLTRAVLLGGVWLGALATVAPDAAHAVDATWTGPGAEWTTGINWSSSPTVPDNVATFTNNGAPTSVTIANDASINTIQFTAAAPAYSFTINNGVTFNIDGTGIANSSASTPSFINNGRLVFDTPALTTASGAIDISGTGGLGKSGSGTLVLSGNNSYAGSTDVSAGALIVASNTATPGQTFVTVNTGATLAIADGVEAQIGSLADGPLGSGTVLIGLVDPTNTRLRIGGNGAGNTTFSGTITGAGSLELDNTASLTLTGSGSAIGGNLELCNCATGGLTIDGGSLSVAGNGPSPVSGVAVFGGTLAVTNGGTLQIGTSMQPSDLLVASNMIITGSGSTVTTSGFTGFGIFGPGTLTISNGGMLDSQGGAEIDAFPFSGTPTVLVTGAGSTWTVGGFGLAVGGGSTGGPGMLTISNGGAVNVTGLTTVGDFDNGSSTLTVTGAGSVLNALAGLAVGDAGCGCDPVGALTIADGGVVNSPGSTLIDAGGTLNLGIGGLAGSIVTPAIVNDGRIAANFTDTLTLGANISGVGTLSKAGVGTLVLTDNNSYSGGTTVTGGFINFNSATSFGTGPITLDGGGLQWATGNSADVSSQLAAFGAGGATFDTNGNNVTLASALSGPGGLTKVGAGTMTLSGINTYQGGTAINGGTLAVATDANLGAASGGVAFDGGTLQFLAGFTTNRAVTLNAGGGAFDTNGNNATLAGAIGGIGGLTKFGVGTLTLTGINTYAGGTMVSGGTLQLGDAANTGAIRGNVTNNARFDIVNADTSGITAITNTGTVSFFNASTAGSAVISNDGAIVFNDTSSAGDATITSNFALLFLNASSGGNAAITNNRGLAFLDASSAGNATIMTNNGGTTAFSANSTGGSARLITNSGGAVDISALASAGMTAGSIEGAGTYSLGSKQLTVGGNNLSTQVSGLIADGGAFGGTGGSLVKVGTGTLTLSGANTYSGGTTLAGGTLRLENNQALGSGALTTTGSVVDYANGVTIANPIVINSNTTQLQVTAGSATQAGVISELNGPRPLEKIGAGALVLTAANTYTGPTTISAGTLVVNGSIANSAVTVNNGGILAGTGTVGVTAIDAGGTFAPGSGTPGSSMTVAGNLAFQSGALYLVQVNPANASSAGVIAGGGAALAGTVNAAFATGGYVSRTYTILSAAGGRNGTFNALTTTNLPAGFTANLSYTGSDVILNLTATLGQQQIATGSLSINQQNVANSLNTFFNSGGALPPAFVSVFGLTGGNLGNALSQLSGEAATGGQQAAFQLGNQFLTLMLDPFVDGRAGLSGTPGTAIGFAPEREAVPDEVALAYAAVLKAPKKAQPQTFEQRWGVWGAGYGGSNRTTGDPAVLGSHDLSARTAGFAGGIDYRLAPNTVVGVALAGGGTDWSLAQGLGGGKSDAFQAGVYGVTRWDALYLAASFAYTNHWMSTDRVAFAGDHLTAKFNAQSLGGRLEGGYRLATMFGALTPYAAVQAQSFRTPGYSETDVNGGGFALAYNSRTGTDTRSELGARFDRVVAFNPTAVVALRGRLAWAHDWVSDPTLAAVFQTLPGASFIVNGAVPARDSALASAGAELRLANGVSLLGKFDGEFARGSSTYAGTGTIRYAW
jgi:autotransporter-associated beta strand protein/T5SS/PEP-CTERM-associated repeat protein